MYTIHLIPFQIFRDFFKNINMSANYNATFTHMPTIKKKPNRTNQCETQQM